MNYFPEKNVSTYVEDINSVEVDSNLISSQFYPMNFPYISLTFFIHVFLQIFTYPPGIPTIFTLIPEIFHSNPQTEGG